MTPARIVEALDVVEYVKGGFVTAVEATPIQQLAFECGEEALPRFIHHSGQYAHGNVIAGVLVD